MQYIGHQRDIKEQVRKTLAVARINSRIQIAGILGFRATQRRSQGDQEVTGGPGTLGQLHEGFLHLTLFQLGHPCYNCGAASVFHLAPLHHPDHLLRGTDDLKNASISAEREVLEQPNASLMPRTENLRRLQLRRSSSRDLPFHQLTDTDALNSPTPATTHKTNTSQPGKNHNHHTVIIINTLS